MSECSHCGTCCRWMIICREGVEPTVRDYLIARGARMEQGLILIPSRCPQLYKKGKDFLCKIQKSKPKICSDFSGTNECNGRYAWVPKNCTMRQHDKQPTGNTDE